MTLDPNTLLIAIISAVPATLAALYGRRGAKSSGNNSDKLDQVGQQFAPNGSASLRDQTDRLEQNLNDYILESRAHLTRQDDMLVAGQRRFEKLEGLVTTLGHRTAGIERKIRLCLKTLDAHDGPDSIRLRGVAPKSGSVEPSRGDNEAGDSNPAHRRRLRMASSASLPRLKGSTDPAFAEAPSGQSHSEPS